ncbi:hypothetical protein JTE90_016936 [Oedothorax gibbosus]|uniref:Uncharacterized protein n=1 Tax=Oedothorax gibbosus TaxID=931172 RepID=A0AAV6UV46_9ARAC|nr:hypothetical protein JTE90_016936 [Oedothorax gibbosus]
MYHISVPICEYFSLKIHQVPNVTYPDSEIRMYDPGINRFVGISHVTNVILVAGSRILCSHVATRQVLSPNPSLFPPRHQLSISFITVTHTIVKFEEVSTTQVTPSSYPDKCSKRDGGGRGEGMLFSLIRDAEDLALHPPLDFRRRENGDRFRNCGISAPKVRRYAF